MTELTVRGVTVRARGEAARPTTVLMLLHGRGASATNILALVDRLTLPATTLVIAPDAPGHQWYPERFIVPKANNEPQLTNSLQTIDTLVHGAREQFNLSPEQIFLAGFSQGACLVAEYLKQKPRRYRGAAIMSGGLIGTDAEVIETLSDNSLADTPVYLGCDIKDFHIPRERVTLSAEVLTTLVAHVDMRLYEGLGHTIHPEAKSFIEQHI